MSLRVRPWTVKQGKPWVEKVHRRLPKIQGAMWCLSVRDGDVVVGAALVGNAVGQWSDVTLSVLRVAVLEGYRNACSMLYGCCSKMAHASGADNLVTYLHGDEHGASLRASGWIFDGTTDGGEFDRPSRPRGPAVDPTPKQRWFALWSARVRGGAREAA